MESSEAKRGPGGRVLQATVHYGLAGYLPRLVNFLLLPVYAIYLPPDEMGILEIYITVQILMQSFSRFGLPGALSRQYFDHRQEPELSDLITTMTVGVFGAAAVSSLFVFGGAPLVFERWLPTVPVHPYLEVSLIAAFLQCGRELQARLLQAQEESRLAATLNIVLSLFGAGAKVLFVVGLDMKAIGALWADVAAAALGLIIAFYRHRGHLRGRLRWSMLKPGLAYGIPLMPHRLGAWVQDSAGHWIMGALGAVSAVGQLGLASRVVSPLRVGTGAFGTALAPVYFGWRTDLSGEEALSQGRQVALASLVVGGIGAIGAACFGSVAIRHLTPDTYLASAQVTGLLASALLLRLAYELPALEIFYNKQTKYISYIFLLGSCVNIPVTAWLVPSLGATGAAIGQLSGMMLALSLTMVVARRTFPSLLTIRAIAVTTVAVVAAGVAPFAIPHRGVFFDLAVAGALFGLATAVLFFASGVRPAQIRAHVVDAVRNRGRKRKKAAEASPEVAESGGPEA